MRTLKESWKEAPQAIEELEKEGEVLVTRTVKDGQLRMVFWNEIKPTEDSGGMQVEKGKFTHYVAIHHRILKNLSEFLDLWHSLKVPNDVDLLKQLASGMAFPRLVYNLFFWLTFHPEGLQVTAAETVVPKAPTTKKKGKRGGAPRQRQVRITNTHLKGEIDLQRDYANHTK